MTCICATAIGLINVYFMGNQKNPDLIAGVGMGSMLINVLFFAIGQGLNGTIETFVSQANGAGLHYMCGVYLNRARVLVSLVLLPIAFVFYFTDVILISLD
jgi:MATE family multidrug resistance protein